MPVYEFSCPACFSRGILSVWEMSFKVSDPKVTFCPACGKPGKQVMLTAPAVSTRAKHYQQVDRSFEEAYRAQTGLDPRSPEALRKEANPTSRDSDIVAQLQSMGVRLDPHFAPNPAQQLAAAQGAGDSRELAFSHPKPVFVARDDPAHRERVSEALASFKRENGS